ncbi:endo-1,4-beta-xylanase [Marinicellulosiphila megalodicopiae]|uniref:endo-1,4-beta-xylanase n=1 Tax=Marinicellulosiphila megalodicopiae TaxID=2724896 RepID=UPI003BAF4ED9
MIKPFQIAMSAITLIALSSCIEPLGDSPKNNAPSATPNQVNNTVFSNSQDPENDALQYKWTLIENNLNLGSTENLDISQWVDVIDGPKYVSLMIDDGSNSVTFPVFLVDFGSNQTNDNPPTARFTSSSLSGQIPFTVDFDASNSSDDNEIKSYTWFINNQTINNQTSEQKQISYEFTEAGNFDIKLIVTDSANQSAEFAQTISATQAVIDQPIDVEFTLSKTQIDITDTLTLTVDNPNSNISYEWDIGGIKKSGPSITHSFSEIGQYDITLSATDANNPNQSNSKTISVSVINNQPEPEISIVSNSGLTINLAINFDSSPISYQWTVDNKTFNNNTLEYTFATSGAYTVKLSANYGDGFIEHDSINVMVSAPALPICTVTINNDPYCKADASTDDNGDGWGWENELSCIYVGGAADPAPGSCELEDLNPGQGTSADRIMYMGEPLYLSGFNIAWFDFASDVGNGVDTNQLNQAITDLKQAGGNTLRWWIHTDGYLTPSWNNGLVSGPGTNFIRDMKTALDIAQQQGVYIVPSLWSFDMLNDNEFRNPPVADNYKLLTQNNVLQSYIDNAITPMVTQLNDHPALVAWEIFNEPENMTESWFAERTTVNTAQANALTLEDIQRVTAKLAAAIHQTAIDNGQTALVTTGSKSMGKYNSDVAGGTNLYSDERLMALNNNNPLSILDFYQPHYYNNEGKQGDWSVFHHDASYWNVDKPIVVGEFYVNDGLKNSNDAPLKSQYADLTTEQMCQALVNGGYAGGWAWQWNEYAAQIKSCLNPITIDLGKGSDEISAIDSNRGDDYAGIGNGLSSLAPFPIGLAIPDGTGTSGVSILTNTTRQNILKADFSQITVENKMKMSYVENSFTEADAIVDWAINNDIGVHGHALVWHHTSQLPSWAINPGNDFKTKFKEQITRTATHFKGKVYSWDVVNEALFDPNDGSGHTNNNGFRNSVYFNQYNGSSYIDEAFRTAREADPTAILYYNDFNTEENSDKTTALVNLVQGLLDNDVPIDGVGFQMHVVNSWPPISNIRSAMQKIVDIDPNLMVKITELDVRINNVYDENENNDFINRNDCNVSCTGLTAQKARYKEIIEAYLDVVPEHRRGGITVWGVADLDSWLYENNGDRKLPDWPLMFNDNFEKKPAFFGVQEAIQTINN